MIRRSTWMVVAAFVILAGVVWWARGQKTGAEAAATPEATATPLPRLLPDLEPEQVVQVILEEPATGRRLVLERVAATPTPEATPTAAATPSGSPTPPEPQWAVVEPQGLDAPEAWRVNTAVEGLVYARVQAVLPPDTDPAALGLAGPAQRIELVTQDGRSLAVWIGVTTPLQNGYYVKVEGRPDIMATGQYAIQSLWDLLNELVPLETTPTATPTP